MSWLFRSTLPGRATWPQEDLSDLLIRSGDVCSCQAGPAGAASNYLAFGTGMDFMYTQLGVPYSLTYEVYGRANPFGGGEPGRIPPGRVGWVGWAGACRIAAAAGVEGEGEGEEDKRPGRGNGCGG